MKVVGYCRVSTEEQVESGLGMDSQKSKIEAYCKMKDFDLVAVFQDNGCSGAKHLSERPEGAKLCTMLDEGGAEAVIILKLDRAFRNATDCTAMDDKWKANGVGLHIMDLGGNAIDTCTSAGRFMLRMTS